MRVVYEAETPLHVFRVLLQDEWIVFERFNKCTGGKDGTFPIPASVMMADGLRDAIEKNQIR